MVKGNQKEQKQGEKQLFTGFASVEVVAINPSRDDLNALLSRDRTPEDKEFTYLSKDDKGNDKLRLAIWLKDEKNRYFINSFSLIREENASKAGKPQFVNSVCATHYCDNEKLLPEWFTLFQNKEKTETLGKKKYRRALIGEEKLVTLMRTWLGRMSWYDADSEVLIDTNKLFSEDYREVRSLIKSEWDTPFVTLLGVRTDDKDTSKKYQDVYDKSYLPGGFMKYINNGFKFPSDYSKKIWDKFKDEVIGLHGFKSHFELQPLAEYDVSQDLTASDQTKVPPKQPAKQSSDY